MLSPGTSSFYSPLCVNCSLLWNVLRPSCLWNFLYYFAFFSFLYSGKVSVMHNNVFLWQIYFCRIQELIFRCKLWNLDGEIILKALQQSACHVSFMIIWKKHISFMGPDWTLCCPWDYGIRRIYGTWHNAGNIWLHEHSYGHWETTIIEPLKILS